MNGSEFLSANRNTLETKANWGELEQQKCMIFYVSEKDLLGDLVPIVYNEHVKYCDEAPSVGVEVVEVE